jgi:small subunit ribosomal protein S6
LLGSFLQAEKTIGGFEMNKYEALYLLSASIADATKEKLIKRFEDVVIKGGGTVDKTDKWGNRKLAYPIDFKTEGYYVLMDFTSPVELPKELERQMRISDGVLRFIITRKEEVKKPKTKGTKKAPAKKREEHGGEGK